MKRFFIPALTAVIILTAGAVCYAETDISVDQSPESDEVSIRISSDKKADAQPVLIRILDEGGAENFIELGYTDAEGVFELTYLNDTGHGKHTVYVNIGGELITSSYIKLGSYEYKEFVNVLNAQHKSTSPSGDPIKAVFDKYAEYVDIDMERANKLIYPDKVYQIMAEDDSYKGRISDFYDVRRAFYAAVATESCNEDKGALYELAAVEPYKSVISAFAPVLYDSSTAASNSVKAAASEAMNKEYKSFKGLVTDAEFYLLQKTISGATHWNDVKSALIKYKAVLGIDPAKASDQVFKGMMGRTYTSYNGITDAFRALSSEAQQQTSGGGSGGGGGGGGGGGSVSGGVVLRPIEAAPTATPAAGTDSSTQATGSTGALPFEDMDEAKWALEAVDYTYKLGIVSGVSDTRFEPNRFISRAEALKLLMVMMGQEPEDASTPFLDVTPNDWFFTYIGAAYRLGIVNGKSDTEFDAHSTVTRQEMAVMTYRVMRLMGKLKDSSAEAVFGDREEISDWAFEAVNYMFANKLMVGRTGQVFDPKDDLTRAEAVTVIYNVVKGDAK